MKTLSLAAILFAIAFQAVCEASPTRVRWPGWIVTSSEALYYGRKHWSFPLTNLFDGNPATAWVFSGTGKHREWEESGYVIEMYRGMYRKPPVTLNSIWIMNGHNKSRELFLRNNRIVGLKVYLDDKLVKTVALSDSMGWHKISVPRQSVGVIKLRFTRFKKGRDNDVCVSEIALYDRGRRIDLNMP